MQLKPEYFVISGLALAVGAVAGFLVGDRYNSEYYNLLLEEEAELIQRRANENVKRQIEHFHELYQEATKAHQLYLGIEPTDETEAKAEEVLQVVLSKKDDPHTNEGEDEETVEVVIHPEDSTGLAEVSFPVRPSRNIQPENHIDISIMDEERRKNFDQIVASGNPYHSDVRRNIPGNNEPMPNPGTIMYDDPDNLFEVSHMLTKEEGLESETGFTLGTLTYYVGNDTLLDERDQVVEDVIKQMVGVKNLEELATGPEEIIYVRNNKLEREFEIIRNPGDYEEPEHEFKNAQGPDARPRGGDRM
jgi:hypothetical protein